MLFPGEMTEFTSVIFPSSCGHFCGVACIEASKEEKEEDCVFCLQMCLVEFVLKNTPIDLDDSVRNGKVNCLQIT